VVISLFSVLLFYFSMPGHHRLKICKLPYYLTILVALGGITHFAAMIYLGLMERAKESDQASWTPADKEEHLGQISFFFVVLGIGLSMKIAIYPQIVPFIVKDEMKIESAHAYNQSSDHLLTSITVLAVGIYSQVRPVETYKFACYIFIALTGICSFFYTKLYRFDKEKKASMLDLQPLGEKKSYIDPNRQNKLLEARAMTP
jgi:hypothetical protein